VEFLQCESYRQHDKLINIKKNLNLGKLELACTIDELQKLNVFGNQKTIFSSLKTFYFLFFLRKLLVNNIEWFFGSLAFKSRETSTKNNLSSDSSVHGSV
jgi:hypothetical protein